MNMLRNLSPTKALNGKTPHEAYHGVKPDVGHLRPFGTEVTCRNSEQKNKLSPRAWKGKLVGYEGSKIIRVYDSTRRKIYRTDYFRFESTEPSMIIYLNEEENEEEHCFFIARSDSTLYRLKLVN